MPRIPFWIFIIIALLHLSAIRVDIMDIDASQYAEISREMAQTRDYLHIYDRGDQYLDKPPFLFWVSALGIRAFGATNLGYKLPSILLGFLAVYATYRLARLLYDEATGRMAALILFCCQGMFLMTNDVRCDLVLMSWTVTALWLIYEWSLNKKLLYLLGGAAAIALGMMSKGPIALLAPAFALCSHWALKRQWRMFFRPQYLLAVVVIALLLVPMSIGLYQQYDLHPEKFINGQQGVSGLKFFYWTQSFGRITGESSWNNGADISFLLVNMLWSFLPWIFLFLPALFIRVKQLITQRFRLQPGQEALSTGGFLLCYLALGMSKYQLPHYIFVAFPMAAILCAGLLHDMYAAGRFVKLEKVMQVVMKVAGLLLFTGVFLILTVTFPAHWSWLILWGLALATWLYFIFRRKLSGNMLWAGTLAAILVNLFLTHRFYKPLMQYQVGAVAGKYIRNNHIDPARVVAYRMHDPLNSLHYYANGAIRVFSNAGSMPTGAGDYVLTQDDGLQELKAGNYKLDIVLQGQLFKVSELVPVFLSATSRHEVTKPYYLVRIITN